MLTTPLRKFAVTVTGVLLALALVLALGTVSTRPAMAATLGATPTLTVQADGSVPNEDEPGWNPCTMGNLGPCDLSSILPGGGWLTVNVAELHDPQGITCEGTLVPVRVSVAAVTGDGETVRAHAAVLVCASRVSPPIAPQVAELLPGLYRVVGSQV
jgi:hypothetical protein